MTCSRCGKRTDGQPIAEVYVDVDASLNEKRGIVYQMKGWDMRRALVALRLEVPSDIADHLENRFDAVLASQTDARTALAEIAAAAAELLVSQSYDDEGRIIVLRRALQHLDQALTTHAAAIRGAK